MQTPHFSFPMKTKFLFLLCQLGFIIGHGQTASKDSLYSVAHLKEDLAYLQQQLNQVHANPYTEFSAKQYEQLFNSIHAKLTTPLTTTDFLLLVKPVIAHLGDEHAFIGPPQPAQAAKTSCQERISYQQYGKTGYINACSFDVKNDREFTLDAIFKKIDSIFKLIQDAGIQKLVIDVSNNEGGNSAVGGYLIASFYKKPYKNYQCNWKRSAEYQKLYESWGIKNELYANTPIGNIIHFDASTTTPQEVLYPFNGKVTVVVGQHTFSSAILFATLIKDNKIAPIIGQIPTNGHPNHFGEMYNTKLPNTRIELRFGVKEWIRPAGKGKGQDNQLVPDVLLSNADMSDVLKIIEKAK